MNRRARTRVPALLAGTAALCLAALAGCLFDDQSAKRGSEIENELGVGRIVLADGSPAVGAKVRIYTVDHLPQPDILAKRARAVFEALTDREGRYRIDSLPGGEYNILGELDGEVSYADSVLITGEKSRLPTDTLGEAGAAAGRVELQPNHDPRTATVQVLGTQVYANVADDGAFVLEGLAEGLYRLRVATTEPEYTPLYATLRIRSGRIDTLPAPLRPIYTGIPVVTGLRAAFDTLAQVVTVEWDATDYRQFQEYLVYRTPAGSLSGTATLMARTRVPAFFDSLDASAPGSPGSRGFEYRVRLRNKSDQIGLAYGFAEAAAAPRSLVQTDLQSSFASGNDHAGILDSVTVRVRYRNPTRRILKLEWLPADADSVLAWRADSSLEGGSEITLAWETPGRYALRARATDEAGNRSETAVVVTIHRDEPEASAGADTLVEPGTWLRLRGAGTDRYGTIAKLEWDIGGAGNFVAVPDGDTVVRAPDTAIEAYTCVLRATDNRGLTGLDTVIAFVLPIRERLAPEEPSIGRAHGGKIIFGTSGTGTFAFDLAGDRFEATPSLQGRLHHLEVVDGSLYAFVQRPPGFPFDRHKVEKWNGNGGWNDMGNHDIGWPNYFVPRTRGRQLWVMNVLKREEFGSEGYTTMWSWDADGNTGRDYEKEIWPGMLDPNAAPPIVPSWGGRIIGENFLMAYGKDKQSRDSRVVRSFHIPTRTWHYKAERLNAMPVHAEFAHEGEWYVLAENGNLESYDPEADRWTARAPVPGFNLPYTYQQHHAPRFLASRGKARLFVKDGGRIRYWEYDIAADAWKRIGSLPTGSGSFDVVQAGDRAFLFSGRQFLEFLPD